MIAFFFFHHTLQGATEIVLLFGVATRNGLLLVDNYNTKFASGMSLRDLLIQGSMGRLNAILMTAFTSALGLAPLVVAGGAGKELLQPLSIVVLGGLFTSTALTLLVLPALYSQFWKYLMPHQVQLDTQCKTGSDLESRILG